MFDKEIQEVKDMIAEVKPLATEYLKLKNSQIQNLEKIVVELTRINENLKEIKEVVK